MTEDMDPIAVLCELAEQAMRRLGTRFQVTVKGDYRDFPITLTVTVDEYKEEAKPDAVPKDQDV